MDEIINPNESELDLDEYKLRPGYLREYIGQKDVKENLNVFIPRVMRNLKYLKLHRYISRSCLRQSQKQYRILS